MKEGSLSVAGAINAVVVIRQVCSQAYELVPIVRTMSFRIIIVEMALASQSHGQPKKLQEKRWMTQRRRWLFAFLTAFYVTFWFDVYLFY